MENKHQKTLLQTIQCNLERNEKGDIFVNYDTSGPWRILDKPPTSGMVRYYTPAFHLGIDPYGVQLFSEPSPSASIMQTIILEAEARRHFPLMDTKQVAKYISVSIEQANKK